MVMRVSGMKPGAMAVVSCVVYSGSLLATAFVLDRMVLSAPFMLVLFGGSATLLAFATGMVRLPQLRSLLPRAERP